MMLVAPMLAIQERADHRGRVVLPCVPPTATALGLSRIRSASRSLRWITGIPRRFASTTSTLSAATAAETPGSRVADVGRIMPFRKRSRFQQALGNLRALGLIQKHHSQGSGGFRQAAHADPPTPTK